ncbi:MAG: hypothetical protein ACLTYW_06200 [Collinsella sp.]
MNEISNIHAFEDEDFLPALCGDGRARRICRVPGAGVYAAGWAADLDAADAGGWTAVLGWIVGLTAVSAASFAVHELVHAVFFKLFAPAGAQVTFRANLDLHDLRLRRGRGVFAPAVWSLPSADGCCDDNVCPGACVLGLSAAVLPGGLHLSGCVGDWYYVRTILRDRRIVACEDTSFGVRFFAR